MNFLKNNKFKIIYFSFLLLLSLCSYLLSQIYPSLKFFLIVPVALFLGLYMPFVFESVIPIKNILHYFSFSLFCGFFFNSLIIFFLGLIGVPINELFFIIYISLMFLLNSILYFLFLPEDKIKSFFRNFRPKFVDIIWLSVFFVIFLVFVQITTERYFPNWDNFTYWAIDAKFIFENHNLNGRNLDVLQNFYLPFYPLQLSYVYFLYEEVVEQYSSLITLLYGYISLLYLSSYIIDSKKNSIVKNLLYFLS